MRVSSCEPVGRPANDASPFELVVVIAPSRSTVAPASGALVEQSLAWTVAEARLVSVPVTI